MKITTLDGKRASEHDIIALETVLGQRLSPSVRDFVEDNDGATPENNIFKVDSGNNSGVNAFIPVVEIIKERRRMEDLRPHVYPIAWAEGGNYVVIDESKHGSVFFWDHEMPGNLIKLASSFQEFLGLLEPFDVEFIHLKPGQVTRAWIDPDFLKLLNQK